MTEERRVVTVLFADIVDSTGLGEDLDPEDVRWLMTTYFGIAREAIEEYGGTVEKFIGDAVMATFGLPRAHDDDARRALTAALLLRDRIRADERLAGRMPVRLGLNSGEVASGSDPLTGQPLITGDAVNVAARLQQQAQPWSILVAERTMLAAGSSFAFGPLIEVEARGRSGAVRAAELLAARAATAVAPPFVGRDHDLAHLQLLARRVFSEGRPWLVTIVAPPGTGKSRLLAEFLDSLPDLGVAPTVAVARCLPYGQRLAYQPMRDVLDALIGLDDGSSAGELLERTRPWLEAAGVAVPNRTAELLAATIGVAAPAGPPATGELLVAWRTLIEAAARRQPLVLAFEDLHWSSDSLLDLVDFLIQPRRDVPALLIAVARPELLERRPGWNSGRRNQTTLDLAPLDSEPIAAIVAHLLAPAEGALVEAIVARAEGNPFFATEIVRSIIERARPGGVGERLDVALELPDTVQATIQARLDHLEPGDRRVLQIGAVFGRSFKVTGVASVTGLDASEVATSVDRLAERDLVAFGQDGEIAARHILIRDVAYHGMTRPNRARAHAAAAAWLAEHVDGGEQPAELIAFHYREAAGLLASMEEHPAELPVIKHAAVTWLRRAAERAHAAAASADVADQLQAAIELAEPGELPELYERLGDAELQGELSAAAYSRARELAREVGLPADIQLRILGKLLMQYTRTPGSVASRPSAAEMDVLVSAGSRLVARATDKQAEARFLIAQAFLPFWALDADMPADRAGAIAVARDGLKMAQDLDDADLQSAALDALTFLADSWPEALDHALQRLQFGDRLRLGERIDAHAVVTWLAATVGRLAEAERVSSAGLALVGQGQVPSFALHLAAWRAYALRLAGQWDELEELVERALELWVETGRSAAGFAIRGFIDAFEVARARGRTELAERLKTALLEIIGQFPDGALVSQRKAFLEPRPEALRGMLDKDVVNQNAGVGGLADSLERAAGRLIDGGVAINGGTWRHLLEAAQNAGCRMLEAQARRGLGVADADQTELRAALAIAQSAGALPLIGRLQVELGRLLADPALVDAGRIRLERLGDQEQLARLARTTASAAE